MSKYHDALFPFLTLIPFLIYDLLQLPLLLLLFPFTVALPSDLWFYQSQLFSMAPLGTHFPHLLLCHRGAVTGNFSEGFHTKGRVPSTI